MWLDTVLRLTVDLSTFGIGALGGHVAVNPPERTQKKLKRAYFAAFFLLAIIGIGSNEWERERADALQEAYRNAADTAAKQFSADLKIVKDDDSAVLRFLENPPRGLTKSDVDAITKNWARAILDNREMPPDITNNELRKEVADLTNGLRDLDKLRGEAYIMTKKPMNLQPGAEERNARWWTLEDQVKNRFENNYKKRGIGLRDLMMKRLNIQGPSFRQS